MSLTASVLHDDGVALLALSGELDVAETALVDEAVDQVLADGLRLVVVDLTGLEFCDSSGLGCLLRTSRVVREAGGTCAVAGARGPVQRLLALMTMERVMTLTDDVSDALVAVRGAAAGA